MPQHFFQYIMWILPVWVVTSALCYALHNHHFGSITISSRILQARFSQGPLILALLWTVGHNHQKKKNFCRQTHRKLFYSSISINSITTNRKKKKSLNPNCNLSSFPHGIRSVGDSPPTQILYTSSQLVWDVVCRWKIIKSFIKKMAQSLIPGAS